MMYESGKGRVMICIEDRQCALIPSIGFIWGSMYWRLRIGFIWLNIQVSIGIIRRK